MNYQYFEDDEEYDQEYSETYSEDEYQEEEEAEPQTRDEYNQYYLMKLKEMFVQRQVWTLAEWQAYFKQLKYKSIDSIISECENRITGKIVDHLDYRIKMKTIIDEIFPNEISLDFNIVAQISYIKNIIENRSWSYYKPLPTKREIASSPKVLYKASWKIPSLQKISAIACQSLNLELNEVEFDVLNRVLSE